MDNQRRDELEKIVSAWRDADLEAEDPKAEGPISRINVLLAVVRDEISEQKKARLLLKISDTQNPPRTRREDIEKNLQGLSVEE